MRKGGDNFVPGNVSDCPPLFSSLAPAILSLDVFDTALTRLTGDPPALFLILGRKLEQSKLSKTSAEVFARARFAAERRTRENLGHEDITLAEIYLELGIALRLCEAARLRIMEQELALERLLVRPVPRTLALVQYARKCGIAVAFVSDTYFPLEFIQDCLRDHGLYRDGDSIYTSSSDRRTKGTGSLFRQLLSATTVPPDRIVHHGNDHHADFMMPSAMGIKASHFRDGNLNRFEEIWESFRWETTGFSSLLAGASRLTRLSVPAHSVKERVLRDVACGVAAPVLVGYVLWILQQARRRKLRRIYFLSREGELLLAIARGLAGRLGLDCELLYLYGSRQAWHLPSVTSMADPITDWLFVAHGHFSIERVLRRICLTPNDVKPALVRLGFGPDHWKRNLSGEEQLRLQAILKDPMFESALLAAAIPKREIALAYFRQLGLLDSVPWAIADVGWAGMIQRSLARILLIAGREMPPTGFYYGLTSGGTELQSGVFDAYMFDNRSRTGFPPSRGIVAWPLIDIFCEGVEGQVLEYETRPDGLVAPVLKEKTNIAALEWGLPIVRSAILRFAESVCVDKNLTDPTTDVRGASAAVISAFWNAPTVDEARVWGCFPYDPEQGGGTSHTLGGPFSWGSIIRLGRRDAMRRRWIAAALITSPRGLRLTLQGARRTRRLLGKVCGRIRHLHWK